MLWAIDIGNTQTVVGLHDGSGWQAVWRLATDHEQTEDQIAGELETLCRLAGLEFAAARVIVASVVPSVEMAWSLFFQKYLGQPAVFLRSGDQVGLPVSYDPPHAVGADRIANAIAALERWAPPIVVVDFGTATTFDCVDADGVYTGGVILPGLTVSMESLVSRTAKLPSVALEAPGRAVGKRTVESIQSGLMFGYADAVDGLVRRIVAELGPCTVVSTGGLGSKFLGLCQEIKQHEPELTLDGLLVASRRLKPGTV
ncbi:MAG: type III pantothenate kinase [Armatimonadetes bacterium]|nr:type III pantothenate kinase [Armatimonadota bacterium]